MADPGTGSDQAVAPPADADNPSIGAEPSTDHSTTATSSGSGMGPARRASIVVGVVVAALVVLFALGRGESADGVTELLGARTPSVTGPTLDGDAFDGPPFDIDDHRGSWVLVNFFATWCPPCVAEHPDLVELDRWGGERGDVELVSVVFNDPPDRVADFFAARGGDWPVIDNAQVPLSFGISQIPETFLVSPNGQVVLHVESQISADEVKRLIEEFEQ